MPGLARGKIGAKRAFRHAVFRKGNSGTFSGHLLWQTGFKNWKWMFQHLRGRVWPGKRANRARFSSSPTSHFGRGINAACHFFRASFWKISTHSSLLKISFGRDLLEKRLHFRMKRRYIAGNLFLTFFSESGNTVKNSNDAPGEKKNGSRSSHQKIASTLRRASPVRFDSGWKTRERTWKTELRVQFSALKNVRWSGMP